MRGFSSVPWARGFSKACGSFAGAGSAFRAQGPLVLLGPSSGPYLQCVGALRSSSGPPRVLIYNARVRSGPPRVLLGSSFTMRGSETPFGLYNVIRRRGGSHAHRRPGSSSVPVDPPLMPSRLRGVVCGPEACRAWNSFPTTLPTAATQ